MDPLFVHLPGHGGLSEPGLLRNDAPPSPLVAPSPEGSPKCPRVSPRFAPRPHSDPKGMWSPPLCCSEITATFDRPGGMRVFTTPPPAWGSLASKEEDADRNGREGGTPAGAGAEPRLIKNRPLRAQNSVPEDSNITEGVGTARRRNATTLPGTREDFPSPGDVKPHHDLREVVSHPSCR